jgi:hypothetical protein
MMWPANLRISSSTGCSLIPNRRKEDAIKIDQILAGCARFAMWQARWIGFELGSANELAADSGPGQILIRLERNLTSLHPACSAKPSRVWQTMTALDSVSHDDYQVTRSSR